MILPRHALIWLDTADMTLIRLWSSLSYLLIPHYNEVTSSRRLCFRQAFSALFTKSFKYTLWNNIGVLSMAPNITWLDNSLQDTPLLKDCSTSPNFPVRSINLHYRLFLTTRAPFTEFSIWMGFLHKRNMKVVKLYAQNAYWLSINWTG